MNKEAVVVMLDCNSSMGKIFASKKDDDQSNAQMGDPLAEPQTRF